ncbi:MAG: hypothetical protein ABIK08_13020 [Pseudomonadota bacterium]
MLVIRYPLGFRWQNDKLTTVRAEPVEALPANRKTVQQRLKVGGHPPWLQEPKESKNDAEF